MRMGLNSFKAPIIPPSGERPRRRAVRVALERAAAMTLLVLGQSGLAPSTHAQAAPAMLARPDSLTALIARAERERKPVVALFSQAGCPYCEALRREQLHPLAAEQHKRGVIVVEFDIADGRSFAPKAPESSPGAGARRATQPGAQPWLAAGAPVALAHTLGIRVAPTVAFLGARGELAERLVGYGARDFYSAYLDDRIESARTAVSAR